MPVTTPKFPPPPPQAPEEVRVLVAAGPHQACVGGHHVHSHDVVRRPAPTPRQVAEATPQGESGDAGERDEAEDGSEAVHLRFAIHVTEQATSLRAGYPPLFVHPHAAHERHVEHKPPVGRGQTCDVVSPTFDAEQKIVFARELHTRNHIGGAEAARDDGGLSVDHGVPDASGLLIADVAR